MCRVSIEGSNFKYRRDIEDLQTFYLLLQSVMSVPGQSGSKVKQEFYVSLKIKNSRVHRKIQKN